MLKWRIIMNILDVLLQNIDHVIRVDQDAPNESNERRRRRGAGM